MGSASGSAGGGCRGSGTLCNASLPAQGKTRTWAVGASVQGVLAVCPPQSCRLACGGPHSPTQHSEDYDAELLDVRGAASGGCGRTVYKLWNMGAALYGLANYP